MSFPAAAAVLLLNGCGGGQTDAAAAAADEATAQAIDIDADSIGGSGKDSIGGTGRDGGDSIEGTGIDGGDGIEGTGAEKGGRQGGGHHGGHHRRCDGANDTYRELLECVTLRGVRGHQRVLQAIADASNGNRVSGAEGYNRSAAYAEWVFRRAGYRVTRQEFQFETSFNVARPLLEQVAPTPGTIVNSTLSYSGTGEVTAPVSAPSQVLGCNATDFAGFPAGNIALISRGSCTFAIKATNAFNAGASAVVIYNNVAGPVGGTLGVDFALDLPVTSVTQDVGLQLAAVPNLVLHVRTNVFRGLATTSNVIAETRRGDPGNVVVVGAHLDSVDDGPGINDNGSGSATILELAEQFAKVRPKNKVRFTLWGAEESGLLGSTHYVDNLPQEERDRIALYLNFDMIGSPNHVFFVYDGDNSDGVGAGPGPEGSTEIEKVFEGFYSRRGLPFKGTDFDGRSDYGPFIAAGIPAGGLFTGAEGMKTAEEAALWGGTAGVAYDPCYHGECDTFDNINETALDINADAVAYSTLYFAKHGLAAAPAAAARSTASPAAQAFRALKWPERPRAVQ